MLVKVLIDNVTKNDLASEWGLALYMEYGGHRFLLDSGSSGKFADNAKAMGTDLSAVDYAVLSHAHYDHSDGLPAFFRVNDHAKVYLRKGITRSCYSKKKFWGYKYNGIGAGILEEQADRLEFVAGDHELAEGVWLIPHKTLGLEKLGKKAGLYIRENGKTFPDDFAHEQSLVFDTPKGLVIFNSCSHGGVDNIITEISATFPEKELYAYVGGMHLYKSTAEEVRRLGERILDTGISHVITGHCTGEEAFEILKETLGDRVEQLYTGMEIEL